MTPYTDWIMFVVGLALIAAAIAVASRGAGRARRLDVDPHELVVPDKPDLDVPPALRDASRPAPTRIYTDRVVLEAIAAGQQDKRQLASIAGLRVDALDRVLDRLERGGLLTRDGGRLVVLAPEFQPGSRVPMQFVAPAGALVHWQRPDGETGTSSISEGVAFLPNDVVALDVRLTDSPPPLVTAALADDPEDEPRVVRHLFEDRDGDA